jgi:hypothetical protein
MSATPRASITLDQILSHTPEHPVPAAGDAVELDYAALPGSVAVQVVTGENGFGLMTVTVGSDVYDYSVGVSRRALVRMAGFDAEKPDGLAQATEKLGAETFAHNLDVLVYQRLVALAELRTGILPFGAMHRASAFEPVDDGAAYRFRSRFALRPKGELSSYDPVEVAFPAKPEASEEQIDAILARAMGGQLSWDMVPEEARPGLERLRGMAREQADRENEMLWRNQVADVCAAALSTRLVEPVPERFVNALREDIANAFAANVEKSGTTWKDYTAQPEFDMEEFKAQMTQNARDSLAQGLALDLVAAHEGIRLDADDVYASVAPMSQGHGAEAVQGLIENGQLPQVLEVALRAKTSGWVAEHAHDLNGTDIAADNA